MSDYRRHFHPGGTFFFTVVTHQRRQILTSELGRDCLRNALREVRSKSHFDIVAIALLPDHLHTVWSLPRGDHEFSRRWSRIKELFTRRYLSGGGSEASQSHSRIADRQRGIWQRRFWEHTVRDDDDLKRCVDYTHWNPKKHGLVNAVKDWPWSSFHRFVQLGEYDADWGRADPVPEFDMPDD